MSLLEQLKGPSKEELIKNFEGSPDDLLLKSCEEYYSDGIKLAFEMGASLENQLKKVRRICLRLIFRLKPYQIWQLHNYLKKDSTQSFPEMTSDYFTSFLTLKSNGLDLNALLEDFYVYFFETQSTPLFFDFDTKSIFESNQFRAYLQIFEPAGHELQTKALCAAVLSGNIIGIHYLIETGANIRTNYNALLCAIFNNDAKITKLLLNNGSNLFASLDKHYKQLKEKSASSNTELSDDIKEIIYKHAQNKKMFVDFYYLNAKRYDNRIFMDIFRK